MTDPDLPAGLPAPAYVPPPLPPSLPERARFAAPAAPLDEAAAVATPDEPAAVATEPDTQVTSVVAPPALPIAALDEPVAGPDETSSRSDVRGLLVPVLAALAVVLAGLTGFLAYKANTTAGAPAVEVSRSQALAASRDAARAVFSYDYRHLAKDFAAGKAVSTGTFAEQYAGTTSKLLDFAVKNKAVVAADVSDASVVRAREDEVVCLVFLNQTSTSSAVATPRITQSRLEMTMKRHGQTWSVASINAL